MRPHSNATGSGGRRRGPRAVAGLAVAVLAAVTACSSPTSQSASVSSGGQGAVLTVVTVVPPQTLDPAKTVQNNAWLEQLAYEPLVVRRSDGDPA